MPHAALLLHSSTVTAVGSEQETTPWSDPQQLKNRGQREREKHVAMTNFRAASQQELKALNATESKSLLVQLTLKPPLEEHRVGLTNIEEILPTLILPISASSSVLIPSRYTRSCTTRLSGLGIIHSCAPIAVAPAVKFANTISRSASSLVFRKPL